LKEYRAEQICNVGIAGHNGAGKTSLTESMVFCMGVTNRIGHVSQGNTVSDYHEDEIAQQMSISLSLLHGEWKEKKVNIVDTPGFSDFFGDVVSGMKGADTVMIVLSAADGIKVGTEQGWDIANKYELPRFFVINHLDKENLHFDEVVKDLHDTFGHKAVLLQFPVETGPHFSKVIDVLKKKLLTLSDDGKAVESDVPADLKDKAESLYNQLVEEAVAVDDELLEKYLETGDLSQDELISCFKKALVGHLIAPIFCVSATRNLGVTTLLDFMTTYLPTPLEVEPVKLEDGRKLTYSKDDPVVAYVFKTVSEAHVGELSYVKVLSGVLKSGSDIFNTTSHNSERIGQIYVLNGKSKDTVTTLYAGDIGALVKLKTTHTSDTLSMKEVQVKLPPIEFPEPVITIAIEPKKQGDENKISNGINTLREEDPTFILSHDPELRQMLVSGQGEMHLDALVKRLKQRFGVEVATKEPKVPYRETIKGNAEAEGKHKKQTGGHGQYGHCCLRLEPSGRGEGFQFVDAIVGGVIPGKYIPAVEKGVVEIMKEGVLANCQVVDVKVTVYHGSYHTVDSSELAFKMAATIAFKKAFMASKPVILEPIYDLEIRVPEEYMGDVMGDISGRRGKIMGMESDGRHQIIKAKVPLSEIHRYFTDLRSMTQGRGLYKRAFSHYEEVSPDIAPKIIEQAKKEKDGEE